MRSFPHVCARNLLKSQICYRIHRMMFIHRHFTCFHKSWIWSILHQILVQWFSCFNTSETTHDVFIKAFMRLNGCVRASKTHVAVRNAGKTSDYQGRFKSQFKFQSQITFWMNFDIKPDFCSLRRNRVPLLPRFTMTGERRDCTTRLHTQPLITVTFRKEKRGETTLGKPWVDFKTTKKCTCNEKKLIFLWNEWMW